MSNFGSRLKALRRERLLTQDELAKELEVLGCSATSKCAISQYENNKRLPETRALANIANFFNVSIDYLLANDDITAQEETFLGLYRTLDARGKEMALGYLTALRDSTRERA